MWTVYVDLMILLNQDSFDLKANISPVSECRNRLLPYLSEDQQRNLTNAIKSKIQSDADKAHKAANRWGLVCAATGTGKSRIGVDMAEKLVNFKADARILLVTPTVKLRDIGWKEEFEVWGKLDIYLNNVTSVCYKSLPKVTGEWDLVILDECHNLTDKQSVLFKNNKIGALLGLTATKPRKGEKIAIFDLVKLAVVYEITLDEAVDLGVVAPYEITVISVPLNRLARDVKAGSKAKPFYTSEFNNYSYFRRVENDPEKTLGQQFYINRMKFIYNLKSKTAAAKELLGRISSEKRVVIFSGSIEQANELSECRFHSGVDDDCYHLFKQMSINTLSCVNSLNEGHNLPMVDYGFVVQLNGNDLHLIQRIGRLIRYRPGHIGRIIVLAAEDTVDMKWVRHATEDLNQNRIKHINYADILAGNVPFNF